MPLSNGEVVLGSEVCSLCAILLTGKQFYITIEISQGFHLWLKARWIIQAGESWTGCDGSRGLNKDRWNTEKGKRHFYLWNDDDAACDMRAMG